MHVGALFSTVIIFTEEQQCLFAKKPLDVSTMFLGVWSGWSCLWRSCRHVAQMNEAKPVALVRLFEAASNKRTRSTCLKPATLHTKHDVFSSSWLSYGQGPTAIFHSNRQMVIIFTSQPVDTIPNIITISLLIFNVRNTLTLRRSYRPNVTDLPCLHVNDDKCNCQLGGPIWASRSRPACPWDT